MFFLVYAIISISIFLVMLANVGSALAKGLIYTYRYINREHKVPAE